MKRLSIVAILLVAGSTARAQTPITSSKPVDFQSEVKPLLESKCLKCHSRGKYKGGFSLESRDSTLKGGESGPAVVSGKSEESLLIHLVEGREEGRRMPDKGSPLSGSEVRTLRSWIDQGMAWPSDTFFGFRRAPVAPRKPTVPPAPPGVELNNPIDRFVAAYAAGAKRQWNWAVVDDARFLRRASLDLVGLLPSSSQTSAYVSDRAPGKEARLVARLLKDKRAYADHWLTFWNDALRNAYKGTGFIDNGRKPITGWLYQSLYENKPYNQFVHELIQPVAGSEGFTKGIVWRGVVNGSQAPPVQAAQNLSQVFLATNLKCASCHDSFVNQWKLTDAYGLAAVFAEKPLEISRCDKPTGQISPVSFIYPELGSIDPKTPRIERMGRLADLVVSKENGRFARAIVNRLWAQLMGRGLVEPLDDLDQPAWSEDLLDWLATDFVEHGFDIKHTLELIATSRTYRLPAMGLSDKADREDFAFGGPVVKRMTAEQFSDAVSILTGVWTPVVDDMLKVDGRGQGGQLTAAQKAIAAAAPPAKRRPSIQATDVGAKWIWSHAQAAQDPGGRVYFRKLVLLDRVPARIIVAASCDNELRLFINGRKVLESTNWERPVSADVTSLFVRGENVVAIEATNWPDPKNGRGAKVTGPNPAALVALVVGIEQDKLVWSLGTDESWLCSPKASGEWSKVGFLADGWKHSFVLRGADRLYSRVDLRSVIENQSSELPSITSPRSVFAFDDPLLSALGRPIREQVVTRRDSTATTLQALEMTNGATLDSKLAAGARSLYSEHRGDPSTLINRLFTSALGRIPSAEELAVAGECLGGKVTVEGLQDLLWCLVMLPEFQLIR